MNTFLNIVEIIVALLLIGSILVQQKGGEMSSIFGGSGETIQQTRRGAEKAIYYFTIYLATVFAGISIARILIV